MNSIKKRSRGLDLLLVTLISLQVLVYLVYLYMFPSFIELNAPNATSWIKNSRAIFHMAYLPIVFSTYSPCSSSRKIVATNGSLTTVVSVGDVRISLSLTLKNILCVPKLFTNLISIHKLIKDLRCNVIFHYSYCAFHDKNIGASQVIKLVF